MRTRATIFVKSAWPSIACVPHSFPESCLRGLRGRKHLRFTCARSSLVNVFLQEEFVYVPEDVQGSSRTDSSPCDRSRAMYEGTC